MPLGQAGIISPILLPCSSESVSSLRFDATALRTLFAITVAVLLMTTIFTVAEQRPDS